MAHITKVFFILIILIISGFSYIAVKSKPGIQSIYGKKFLHSYEEDKQGSGTKVYRNEEYVFPPSRGRRGFQVNEDQSFIDYDIAPTDGELPVRGAWKKTARENSIKVIFDDSAKHKFHKKDYFIEFIKLEKNVVHVKIIESRDG